LEEIGGRLPFVKQVPGYQDGAIVGCPEPDQPLYRLLLSLPIIFHPTQRLIFPEMDVRG
jgi:hypothetical protein